MNCISTPVLICSGTDCQFLVSTTRVLNFARGTATTSRAFVVGFFQNGSPCTQTRHQHTKHNLQQRNMNTHTDADIHTLTETHSHKHTHTKRHVHTHLDILHDVFGEVGHILLHCSRRTWNVLQDVLHPLHERGPRWRAVRTADREGTGNPGTSAAGRPSANFSLCFLLSIQRFVKKLLGLYWNMGTSAIGDTNNFESAFGSRINRAIFSTKLVSQ